MRSRIILFFKMHPICVQVFWTFAKVVLRCWACFVPIQKKTMIFCSFGGRKFDDSPRAIYEEICGRKEFDDWRLIWAFVNPERFEIPRGKKIKIDTPEFFKTLLYCQVWVSNSGMSRGIPMSRKETIQVETWHGTPLKKIGGDEHQNSLGKVKRRKKHEPDKETIRCAQSDFDREIFARVFNADRNAVLLCDLPRNDVLLTFSSEMITEIKKKLNIPPDRKVILYVPTYREYLIDRNHDTYIAPPIDLDKWEKYLGSDYIFLMRAHYAVSKALNLKENEFVKDVSSYPCLHELYMIADLLISDYSSAYFDYSILDRPMFCFAYDLEEYEEKRGLYADLNEVLPCPVDKNEDEVIAHILTLDEVEAFQKTRKFHEKYAPYAGRASQCVVDEIERKLRES